MGCIWFSPYGDLNRIFDATNINGIQRLQGTIKRDRLPLPVDPVTSTSPVVVAGMVKSPVVTCIQWHPVPGSAVTTLIPPFHHPTAAKTAMRNETAFPSSTVVPSAAGDVPQYPGFQRF